MQLLRQDLSGIWLEMEAMWNVYAIMYINLEFVFLLLTI